MDLRMDLNATRGRLFKPEVTHAASHILDVNNHIYQPLRSGSIWHKLNFLAEFNRFEFRVFLLLD